MKTKDGRENNLITTKKKKSAQYGIYIMKNAVIIERTKPILCINHCTVLCMSI